MTSCELCRSPATMFCASDQASLCWVCDSEVHSANFLVARHSRSLLCQVCQSTTPWSASGAKLGQTVSVCKNCVGAADRVLSGGALFQLPTPPDGGGSYDDTDDEDALVVDADYDDERR
ncbi:hypothetical protein Nepgr_013905 [Nepenthes gracilis]|uniref:B box-type domain-containing protein n=1 Tax=Nepenthes gracilis TaxID=150966 RepID=A0AAD3SJW3_NEPGR|nr:hypothetical protein Nepgr_013905 [Nepenthes gracilis]